MRKDLKPSIILHTSFYKYIVYEYHGSNFLIFKNNLRIMQGSSFIKV